jgi:hypothetical protein
VRHRGKVREVGWKGRREGKEMYQREEEEF